MSNLLRTKEKRKSPATIALALGILATTLTGCGVKGYNTGEKELYTQVAEEGNVVLLDGANVRETPNVGPSSSEPNILTQVDLPGDADGVVVPVEDGIWVHDDVNGRWICLTEKTVANTINDVSLGRDLNEDNEGNLVCINEQRVESPWTTTDVID